VADPRDGEPGLDLPIGREIVCLICGDPTVKRGKPCPTCGRIDAGSAEASVLVSLEERLLDRTGEALRMQAALLRRTSAQRRDHAARLTLDTAKLRERLRAQADLLRVLVQKAQRSSTEPQRISRLDSALERLEDALGSPEETVGPSARV
jgi:DNA repair exonuclease SbcCD ATPase subunit